MYTYVDHTTYKVYVNVYCRTSTYTDSDSDNLIISEGARDRVPPKRSVGRRTALATDASVKFEKINTRWRVYRDRPRVTRG